MLGVFEIALVPVTERNDSVDIPMIEQFVSRVIVGSSIMNESVDFQIGVKVAKLGKSDNSGDAVMSFRLDEAQIKG